MSIGSPLRGKCRKASGLLCRTSEGRQLSANFRPLVRSQVRSLGKASQPVETQVQVGISAELERILREHDGESRSLPGRPNGNLLLTEAIPSSSNEP